MAAISFKGERNALAVLRRCWNWAYFGERPETIAQNIAALNGESVLTLAYASNQPTPAAVPSGALALIGTDGTSANNVVAPNGLTIPAGQFLNTPADGLLVGGVVVPTLSPASWTGDAAQAVSRPIAITRLTLQQLTAVQIIFAVASSSGTVTVEHLTGTQAPGGGTALLTAPLSTAGTANTVATGTLISTVSSLQFAPGDRLGLVFSGTETGLVGLVVTYAFQKLS